MTEVHRYRLISDSPVWVWKDMISGMVCDNLLIYRVGFVGDVPVL